MGFGKRLVLRGRMEKFSENYIKGASKNVPLTKQCLAVKCRRIKGARRVENTVDCINKNRYYTFSPKE
jgi:hypothetical protein